jgi:hypothetical protein
MPFAKPYFPGHKDVGLRRYRPLANGGVSGLPLNLGKCAFGHKRMSLPNGCNCMHSCPMPVPSTPPSSDDAPSGYKSTWMDRAGPDAAITIRSARYSLVVFPLALALWGTVVTQKLGIGGVAGVVLTLVGGIVTTLVAFRAGLATANAGGAIARAYTMPSGSSTPYEEQFSYQESLAARGDVAGALESYEAVIAERPAEAAPRLKAAELYARRAGNPGRAAVLFREVRNLATVSPRDALYASSRLIDLYDGPLNDPGRALVELRRLVELHPNTDAAAGARKAIARIKEQRARDQGKG